MSPGWSASSRPPMPRYGSPPRATSTVIAPSTLARSCPAVSSRLVELGGEHRQNEGRAGAERLPLERDRLELELDVVGLAEAPVVAAIRPELRELCTDRPWSRPPSGRAATPRLADVLDKRRGARADSRRRPSPGCRRSPRDRPSARRLSLGCPRRAASLPSGRT